MHRQFEEEKVEQLRRPRNNRRLSARFENRIAGFANQDLFYTIDDERGRPVKGVLSLACLHKMSLHAIQKELADEAARVKLSNEMGIGDSRIVRLLLREYCK
jgi:hypothetical protein